MLNGIENTNNNTNVTERGSNFFGFALPYCIVSYRTRTYTVHNIIFIIWWEGDTGTRTSTTRTSTEDCNVVLVIVVRCDHHWDEILTGP